MPLRPPWIIRCLWIPGQPGLLKGQRSVVTKSMAFEFKKPGMALRHSTSFLNPTCVQPFPDSILIFKKSNSNIILMPLKTP